jgi:transcription elongation GreA/GreB family factor
MSRAFVRESDQDGAELPERPVSPHANFVTPRGLAAIEAQLRSLESQRQAARAAGDTGARARVERDWRYWNARRASARLVEPAAAAPRVRFGTRVTLRLPADALQTFRLVGEDEADAAQGLLSYVAPLARALLGREAGERVPFQGAEAEIVSIEP